MKFQIEQTNQTKVSFVDRIGNQREHDEFSEPWVSIVDLKLQMLQKYSSGLKG